MDPGSHLPPKRASGKRPKKRKFTGNIHTRKTQSEVNSSCASAKKIKLSENDLPEVSSNFDGYRLIDINSLFSFIENNLSCKICGCDVTMTEDILNGLSSNFTLMCKTCSRGYSFHNSKMIGPRNCAEVNLRSVYAMRSIGMGYSALKMFCGIMDLPHPISKKTYNSYVQKMVSSSKKISEKSMQDAAVEEVTLSDSSEVVVSGDGTWKTRGHTSRVGVCTLIGDKTGKVIDTEVLSSFCKGCDTWKNKKGTPEYQNWFTHHEKDCVLNHSGSAGKMEIVGMTRMFQRSVEKNKAKYVGYIGDGDAKTFPAVVSAEPYGANQTISKLECVGHIQKRMGTRLRKLKQNKTKCTDGKSIGGKGRLTDGKIDQLTVYYGNAIREHKDSLKDMRRAVWAVYFHTRSTDAEPLHTFCPEGTNSWCKYQIASANGLDFKHKPSIPLPVMDMIKPIFNDLTKPALLRRCLGGKTQNSNESLNSVIWKLCPKTVGSGRRIAEIATNEATILYNEGNRGRLRVMEELGFSISLFVRECLMKFDKQRIETGELRLQQNTKEMRKKKRNAQKTIAEKLVLKEGVTYSAGAF